MAIHQKDVIKGCREVQLVLMHANFSEADILIGELSVYQGSLSVSNHSTGISRRIDVCVSDTFYLRASADAQNYSYLVSLRPGDVYVIFDMGRYPAVRLSNGSFGFD